MNHTVLNWLDGIVRRLPDKVAFTDSECSMTFGDLDHIASSVGTFLAGKLAPETPVIVMSTRSIITPAVFLGVVRAGCFYAPMDGTMPASRLNQIINVIHAPVMLVDRAFLEIAYTLDYQGEIIILDEILDTLPDEALLKQASGRLLPTSPLYVIFTSGSTGVPKGVITSHESLMYYIDSFCSVMKIDQSDVLGNQAPFDYIAAVRDIYIPLKTGASTVIIPKNEFSMPIQLFETLNRHKVTTLCWSVAGLELPAKFGEFEVKPEYVTKICFSGSVMPCKYLRIWQNSLPNALYVNQYGPTEATASCTYYIVEELVDDSTVLPIGKPYDNYGILLLKDDQTEAGPGEMGEICVRGPVLALGYYGDWERTNTSFIQNPLNPNYRELIYRTGDLGCYRPDGNLEFHGRLDRQIKHMGHRIELGEIEKTAGECSGVLECCAMYQKEKEWLYLFYTGTAESKEIVMYFRKVLPSFMAPRKVVCLEKMPRLPNGKTDMQTLKTFLK